MRETTHDEEKSPEMVCICVQLLRAARRTATRSSAPQHTAVVGWAESGKGSGQMWQNRSQLAGSGKRPLNFPRVLYSPVQCNQHRSLMSTPFR